jgi:hypothetical protein
MSRMDRCRQVVLQLQTISFVADLSLANLIVSPGSSIACPGIDSLKAFLAKHGVP